MKLQPGKLKRWIKELKILFRNPKFVGMLTIAIITVSLPVTILALNTNTDNRQHAYYAPPPSSGSINWCTGSNKTANPTIGLNFNGLGTCGTHGWGRCEPSKSACGSGTWDPQINGGACRNFDSLSGCCYPPQKIVNSSFACGTGGYGTCEQQTTCSSLNGGTHYLFFWNKNDSACKSESGTGSYTLGCCYPRGLDYQSRQSDAACKQSNPAPTTKNTSTNTTNNNTPINNGTSNTTNPGSTSNNTTGNTTGTTNSTSASTSTTATVVPTPDNPPPIGSLDTVSCAANGVVGWACDPSDFTQTLRVDLYLDGPAGSGTILPNSPQANITRETAVGTACGNDPNNVNHGFVYSLPAKLEDGKKHTLYAYGIDYPGTTNDNNTLLPNSPFTFTCFSPKTTTGNITLLFEGIGLNDNPNPLHPNRQIILYFYPPTDTSFQTTPYVSPVGMVTYNNTTGYFSNASFPLPALSAGQYLVLVKSLDGSLVSQIGTGDGTGPITIVTTGGNNFIVDTQNKQDQDADTNVPLLKMGDIITTGTSFNLVDTLDYSAFTDCYGQTPPRLSDACFHHQGIIDTQTQLFLPDLNDDGKVDGTDYTILIGNYGHYGIGASDMNRGKDPTKL